MFQILLQASPTNKTGFFQSLYDAGIANGNWVKFFEGLGNTLYITSMALILGVTLGVLVALLKVNDKSYVELLTESFGKLRTGYKTSVPAFLKALLGFLHRLLPLKALATVYTTIIRGTPVMVQLLIIYYIVLARAPRGAKVYIAALAFGINSGAYVAEIIRSGIQSVGKGQTEAGRSLGLSQGKTMWLIVLPQAVKNILPALSNEFIALLKETSVVGYIAINDITYVADSIRNNQFKTAALYVSAMYYLVLVLGLTVVQRRVERRLSAGD